jgi:hypothetical protein
MPFPVVLEGQVSVASPFPRSSREGGDFDVLYGFVKIKTPPIAPKCGATRLGNRSQLCGTETEWKIFSISGSSPPMKTSTRVFRRIEVM